MGFVRSNFLPSKHWYSKNPVMISNYIDSVSNQAVSLVFGIKSSLSFEWYKCGYQHQFRSLQVVNWFTIWSSIFKEMKMFPTIRKIFNNKTFNCVPNSKRTRYFIKRECENTGIVSVMDTYSCIRMTQHLYPIIEDHPIFNAWSSFQLRWLSVGPFVGLQPLRRSTMAASATIIFSNQ